MRRIVVGVAAGLLLGGSAIASIPPACADTYPRDLKVSQFVRPTAGWSVATFHGRTAATPRAPARGQS
jgi:hypothetical protein